MAGTYTVGDYLLDRLAELGVGHILGVPGDYTLRLLDHVIAHPGIRWVGFTNELNAGYAADGYARMRGLGALFTTFGVGELSAINAITGSYAEHVPVVHIVGGPSTGNQAAHRIVHHSLGDGIFSQFLDMHAKITCARAALTATNATSEIDRVLTRVRDRHLPGYLLVPADVGELEVSPPAAPLLPAGPVTDPNALAAFIGAATRLIQGSAGAARMSVLVGILVHRLGVADAMRRLIEAGPLRYASSPWAKSTLEEASPTFLGIYAGAMSRPEVREAVEDAGTLVVAGVQFTDLNSGFFTQRITRERTIELGVETASVGWATFGPIAMGDALDTLAEIVQSSAGRGEVAPIAAAPAAAGRRHSEPTPLRQSDLWETVTAHLEPGDVVAAEQGTSFFGMAPLRLPRGVSFIGQPLWASIGYTLPAMLGACLARALSRGVLLIGDGAAQMTVQELSTILREEIRAVVVIVDNDGYTVERAIHGPDQPYNDIARWGWERLPAAFAPGRHVSATVVRTGQELDAALAATREVGAPPFSLIRAQLPRMDVPDLLANLARALNTRPGKAPSR